MTDALLVLPGITADTRKKQFVFDFLSKNSPFKVLLPNLWQSLGIRFCSYQLSFFLKRNVHVEENQSLHVLAFISGGFILRHMISRQPGLKLGRVVYVRGPVQEEVPQRIRATMGLWASWKMGGRMLRDLASPNRHQLPYPQHHAGQGVIVEAGVSQMAAALGLRSSDYAALRNSTQFNLPPSDDVLEVKESHDEIYTSPAVLDKVIAFMKGGRFGPG